MAATTDAHAPPSFHHNHDYVDTGILTSSSSLSHRRLNRSASAGHRDHRRKENEIQTINPAAIVALSSSSLMIMSTPSGADSDRELQESWCPEGYVICYNGKVIDDPTRSCAEACIVGGTAKCCSGDDACSGFFGRVCKDGASCMGEYSCQGADIS